MLLFMTFFQAGLKVPRGEPNVTRKVHPLGGPRRVMHNGWA